MYCTRAGMVRTKRHAVERWIKKKLRLKKLLFRSLRTEDDTGRPPPPPVQGRREDARVATIVSGRSSGGERDTCRGMVKVGKSVLGKKKKKIFKSPTPERINKMKTNSLGRNAWYANQIVTTRPRIYILLKILIHASNILQKYL